MTEKPEITSGLRSAIERGYPLEAAIQSFINSGYNKQDVLDSARNINESVISRIPQQSQEKPEESEEEKKEIERRRDLDLEIKKPRKRKFWWIILLSGVLVILLLALVIFIFFKEEAVELLKSLGYTS